ncbi:MAG: flagellar FliJ family protein [Acidimicrobiia bacterium]
MKRYRFRLEQVARVRRIQEEQARGELLMARQRLLEAGAEVAQRTDRLANRVGHRGQITTSSFLAERYHHQGLAQALLAARTAEANAALMVNTRIDEWKAAAQKVSTLERLDSRSRAEYQAEMDREEQKELDDLIITRASQNQNEDEP